MQYKVGFIELRIYVSVPVYDPKVLASMWNLCAENSSRAGAKKQVSISSFVLGYCLSPVFAGHLQAKRWMFRQCDNRIVCAAAKIIFGNQHLGFAKTWNQVKQQCPRVLVDEPMERWFEKSQRSQANSGWWWVTPICRTSLTLFDSIQIAINLFSLIFNWMYSLKSKSITQIWWKINHQTQHFALMAVRTWVGLQVSGCNMLHDLKVLVSLGLKTIENLWNYCPTNEGLDHVVGSFRFVAWRWHQKTLGAGKAWCKLFESHSISSSTWPTSC